MRSTESREQQTTGGWEDRAEPTTASNPDEQGKWTSALIALIGVWMFLEAVLLDLVAAQYWNDLLVGILLLVVGGYNYFRQTNEQYGSPGVAGIAALVGLWLLVTPFVFGAGFDISPFAENLGSWNNLTVGILTFAVGAYSAYRIRHQRAPIVSTT